MYGDSSMLIQEGTGASRKLGPIYDALEHKQYKLAYKLAKQATQKYPKHLGLRALYAVTLERLGKVNEGLEVGRDVLREMRNTGGGGRTGENGSGLDEGVVNTLTIVFKAARRLDELQSTMEVIASEAKGPESVGAHRSLFNACARTFSFLKMQQCAMKLFKKTQDETYLFWAVTSAYLQHNSGGGAAHVLALAETVCRKAVEGAGGMGGVGACGPDAVLIYVEVLFAQGKTAEAMRALREAREKGAKTRLMGSQANMLECALCLGEGDAAGAARLLEEHVKQNPEDWHAFRVLAMLLVAGPGECGDECGGSHLPQTMDAVVSVNPLDKAERMAADMGRGGDLAALRQGGVERMERVMEEAFPAPGDEGEGKRRARARHLIGLDLHARLRPLGRHPDGPPAGNGGPASKVLSFWRDCGSNISFASDVADHLDLFTEEEAEEARGQLSREFEAMLAELEKELGEAEGENNVSSRTKKAFCKALSALEVNFALCRSRPAANAAEESIGLFRRCVDLYRGYDERENTIADPLVSLIASQVYWGGRPAFASDPCRRMHTLLNVLVVLSSGVDLSPYNSEMLLSLSLLFGHLGASELCSDLFWKLDVKYVQLETIGAHVLLPCLLASGNEREASKFCDRHQAFHLDHNRNAGDTFAMTFAQGTFLESVDFNGLRSRLRDSATRFAVAAERAATRVLAKGAQGLSQAAQVAQVERRELDEVLSEGLGGDVLLDEAEAGSGGLHFNQDLSVRPEWFRPVAEGAAGPAGVLRWWDDLEAEDSNQGRQGAAFWWSKPNACNSLGEERASEYRQGYRRGAAYRCELARCLEAALGGEGCGGGAALRAGVERAARSLGLDLSSGPGALDASLVGPGETARKLQVMQLAALAVTANLLDCASGAGGGQALEQGLSALERNVDHAVDQLFASDVKGGLLPDPSLCFFGGKGVVAVSTYVREVVAFHSLVYARWSDLAGELKKRQRKEKRKQAKGGGGSEPPPPSSASPDPKRVRDVVERFRDRHAVLGARLEPLCAQHDAKALASAWLDSFRQSGELSCEGLSRQELGDLGKYEDVLCGVAEGQVGTLKVALDRMAKFLGLLK